MIGMISVTIVFFNMTSEIEKQMMLKFLERNYPVSRVKHNMRFKRGIVLDDGTTYLLGDDFQKQQLFYNMSDLLISIFDCDELTSKAILSNFLQLK